MAGRGRGKRNAINYVQNDEPAFIKQFKAKVGYREGPDVNTKRQKLEYEDEKDRSDTEEEKPVVVVLKHGDLTADQAAEEDQLLKKLEEEKAIQEGKITFKKPVKKVEDATTDTTSNAAEEHAPKPQPTKDKSKHKDRGKNKDVKKSNLLSFDEEEGDDL